MERMNRPFTLFTEASINLADDEKLMRLMVEANFNMVFVGLETPNEASLAECGKSQNRERDLVAAVRKLQSHGLQVQGGFIVGFDSDPHTIFEDQIRFIQKSGIVVAMVGLLNALPGTKLYRRLKKENRLFKNFTGDNTDCSINFASRMDNETLMNGYRRIVSTIYSPKQYYERIKVFLKEYRPLYRQRFRPRFGHFIAFIKSLWVLGVVAKGKRYFWRFLAWTLAKRPRSLPISITLAIYGLHFRKIVERYAGASV
jgi:radical SAM superfamily enzyme YgiQ (UPF0313 family)